MPATPPISASATPCEAHSLTVTTRAFGNAALSSPAVPEYPNAAMFSSVAGTSHSNPSIAISRHGPRNAPSVSSSATGTATCENSSLTGSKPSRRRAWVIPPDVGTSHDSSQQPQPCSVSASRAATSS